MNLVIPIALVLALLSVVGFQQWRLDRAQEKAAEWKTAVAQYEETHEENIKAISECKRIAEQNENQANLHRLRAQEASQRVRSLRERLEQRLEAIDAPVIAGGCPAADDPAYGDWLYDSAKGHHEN